MKALLAGVLILGLASSISAQTIYLSPVTCQPLGRAPDMMGPGHYMYCPRDGTWSGPNYYVRPPWAPFNGALPTFQQGGPQFQWHSHMRSPRDFFMWSDMLEERIARERRPALVP